VRVTAQAVDYSFSRPSPADLAAAGYMGALRYLCTLPNAKAITGDEVTSLHANGLAVGLVWEDGAANALAGAGQGSVDGLKARRQADALGLPMDRPIYAAVDTDAQTFQFDSIDAYLRVFGAQTGRPVGVYGSWLVVESMLDRGAATYAWQTAAWSHGKRSARAHLYQLVGHAPPGCDVNDILQADWGQWPAPAPTPPPEDDMPAVQYQLPDGTIVVSPRTGEKPWVVVGAAAHAFHLLLDEGAVDRTALPVTDPDEVAALLAMTR